MCPSVHQVAIRGATAADLACLASVVELDALLAEPRLDSAFLHFHPSIHQSGCSNYPPPPPRGSYFLIALTSCFSIPQIKSPPLCYSYYLGLLELACPSKQTLYSGSFLTLSPPDLISARLLWSGRWDVAAGRRGE